jgi:hypothetical protein
LVHALYDLIILGVTDPPVELRAQQEAGEEDQAAGHHEVRLPALAAHGKDQEVTTSEPVYGMVTPTIA